MDVLAWASSQSHSPRPSERKPMLLATIDGRRATTTSDTTDRREPESPAFGKIARDGRVRVVDDSLVIDAAGIPARLKPLTSAALGAKDCPPSRHAWCAPCSINS